VIGEPSAIFKHRRWILLVQVRRDRHRVSPCRRVVGPVVHGIYTKELLRKLIDGIDRSAHVRAFQPQELFPPSSVTLIENDSAGRDPSVPSWITMGVSPAASTVETIFGF